MAAKLPDGLRIFSALVAKDMVDAIQSRTILSLILSSLVLMVLLNLPAWVGDGEPTVALYDAGSSGLGFELERSGQIRLREVPSQQALEEYVGLMNEPVLGLVFPPDLDRVRQTSARLELQGYVDHWVSGTRAAEIQSLVEGQISTLIGKPVQIAIERGTVFTHSDGAQPYTVSLIAIMFFLFTGLLVAPHLMMEEKKNKTLDSLLISPASIGQVIAGKAVAGLAICLAGVAVILAFHAKLIVHWPLAILTAVCGTLFAVSLGLVLGTLFQVPQQFKLWAIILMQPLLLPVAVPPELLPDSIEAILIVIPTVGLAKALRLAASARAPLSAFGPALAVVGAWTLASLAAEAWLLRRADR